MPLIQTFKDSIKVAPGVTLTHADFPTKMQCLFVPKRYKILHGGRGSGKCLGLGTKVLMFDGSLKAVESVLEGDLVMGPDSRPRTVLNTTRGIGPLYKVTQKKGMTYVVNDQHILSLKKSENAKKDVRLQPNSNPRSPNGRYPAWACITNINVAEAFKQSQKWFSHFRGYKAGLINYPAKEVPIDPYFLGAWLGDGTCRELRMTSADLEIIGKMSQWANSQGAVVTKNGDLKNKAFDYGFVFKNQKKNPIWQSFLALGLNDNKHIPEMYFSNSEAIRLELLAGLLDTDGHQQSNCYEICQVNERLAKDIKRLADGLGFRCSIGVRKTVCGNNGVTGEAFKISISGNAHRIPCVLPRKSSFKAKPNKDFLVTEIKIEPIGIGHYAGFELDGDHLFCLEDGTVTHNSWGIARALLTIGRQRKIRVLCTREFMKSIQESVYKLLKDQVIELGLHDFYEVQKTTIIGRNGTEFSFIGLRMNVSNVRSYEGVDYCWVEEADVVSATSWEVLVPTIRKEGSEIWVSFNPNLETDETYKRFVLAPPDNAFVVEVNWRDNPFFPSILNDERLTKRRQDYDGYLTTWEGKTRRTLQGAVYAKELRESRLAGRITRVPYDLSKGVYTFWDLGRADMTSIWFAQIVGFEFHIIDFYQNNQEHLDHYLQILQSKNYTYLDNWIPHDGQSKQLGAKLTIEAQMRQKGFKVRIVGNESISNGINAVRTVFPKCYFDEANCAEGIQCLERYQYEVDKVTKEFSDKPLHNFWSHGADAFRYLALGLREREKPIKKEMAPRPSLTGSAGAGWLGN